MASARLKQFAAIAPFVGVGMFVAFLVGIEVGRPGTPAHDPVAEAPSTAPAAGAAIEPEKIAEAMPAIIPAPNDDIQRHLEAAQAALQTASHLLGKATTKDKGGFVEKARADADAAAADFAKAMAYAQAHPDDAANPQPLPAPRQLPRVGNGKAPNVIGAIDALKTAIDEVNSIPGSLGGNRDTLLADLNQTAEDSIAAVNFSSPRPVPQVPPLVGPPPAVGG
jgi:hypothetical protein